MMLVKVLRFSCMFAIFTTVTINLWFINNRMRIDNTPTLTSETTSIFTFNPDSQLQVYEDNNVYSSKRIDTAPHLVNGFVNKTDSLGALHMLTNGGNDSKRNGDTNTTQNIREESEKQTRTTGCVIGVSFWDQQTFSVRNILSLQCWAGHHGMVVVEPFMIDSKFGAPLTTEAMKHNDTMVRMGRMYDLDHWNEYSKKTGYAPLLEWKEFLQQAPRNVIIVEMNRPHRSCSSNSLILPHGFQTIKKLCFEYNPHRVPLSIENLSGHIFGNFSSSNVTVIFSEWSSGATAKNVNLHTVKCQPTQTFAPIVPSKVVYDDAKKYIQKHLNKNDYIAVMLRLEWMVNNVYVEKVEGTITSCLERITNWLEVLKIQTLLNSTFVTIDVGRFGSKTCERLNTGAVLKPVQAFFRAVYGNSSSLQQWESTFEGINFSPGYIGLLQKVIVTQAKCVLIVGSGTFQKHALNMYKELHKANNDACYIVVDFRCQIISSKGFAEDVFIYS